MKAEKIYVLINQKARGTAKHKAAMESAAEHIRKFMPCELVYTESPEEFAKMAKELSADSKNLVAVSGGDGTINFALNEITPGAPLALIPTGTANVIARELGLPKKILDIFKLLLTGALQNIDIGLCCGKKFAFVAGIGFDAVVADSVSSKLKVFLGQAAYAVALFKVLLTYKPARLTIESDDGSKVEGDFAIFANMRRYGGEMYFAPEARYDDGLLNLVLLRDFSFLSLLKLIKYAYFGGRFPSEVATKVISKHFKVIASKPTMYELDGEVFGPEKEFEIGVEPSSQKVMTT